MWRKKLMRSKSTCDKKNHIHILIDFVIRKKHFHNEYNACDDDKRFELYFVIQLSD